MTFKLNASRALPATDTYLTGLLVEKNPKEVPRSIFVGVA